MGDVAVIGILIGPKGRGSNMMAIAGACASGEIPARVGVVISPVDGTPAVDNARRVGLPVVIIPPDTDRYGEALLGGLQQAGCDLVCLAGYLRLLPSEVLRAYPNRILNIHPALLPKHGGKGMYGMRVHQAVIEAGDAESGATVHFVNEQYDDGEIILQLRCAVLADDTLESLAARVLALEHKAFPQAIKKVLDGS